jgi:hypothetical protein
MEIVYSVFSGSPTFYFSLEDILCSLYCHSGSTFRRRHDQRKYKGRRVSACDSALDSFTAQKVELVWQEVISRSRHLVFRWCLILTKGEVVRNPAQGLQHEGRLWLCSRGLGELEKKLWRRGGAAWRKISALARDLFLRLYRNVTDPNDPFISVDHDLQSLLLQVGRTLNLFCLAWMGVAALPLPNLWFTLWLYDRIT